ncbi:class I adenylate-forming enzyme family protein [Solwaraspora sp. WMMD406]|uniref:class I adenylate-forming enzyme family protein n=1 Tax=Solwaraspora sp. WMMD406 TaxID=3016095 RepID=UPI0024163E29|nr:class I adenylate-forming enzyme family protein [Solwaraspora sp. WMMD406]MDG4766055.1 class I adenylate-forming enzyme family protein [Solwaraspora sp. WMMD406]
MTAPAPGAFDAALLDQAARQPHRPLFTFAGHDTVDRAEYAELAGRAAAVLAAVGVGRGDRIAVWAENSLAWLLLLAAAAWRGATLITLHPGLTEPEVTAALRRSGARRVFAADRIRDRDAYQIAVRAAAVPVTRLAGDLGRGALAAEPGWSDPPPAPAARPDEPLNVQFTSGSTGLPKLVVLTGRNLTANAAWTAQAAGLVADDRIAGPLPFAHAAGLSSGAVLAVVTGAQLVSAPRFQPDVVFDGIQRHRCTVIQFVPTMATMLIDRLAERPGRWDVSSLRRGFLGGATCPPALRDRVKRELGLRRLVVVYGQTEAGPTISVDPDDDTCRPAGTTVGRVLPQLRARVVTPGGGLPVPAGAEGELQVRGESVTVGYLDDEVATREAINPDGWLRTGDLARLATDGTVTLTGRVRELIIRGGENVSPAEVESVLLEQAGVSQACVVGVASPRWGEEVGAALVAAAGAELSTDQLAEAAAARLTRYKTPTRWRVVDRLPLLPSGKVDRLAVASLLAGESG